MTQAIEALLGGPSNFDVGLQFDQWVDHYLPQVGPAVPNPLRQPAATATYLNGVRHTVLEGAKQHPLIRITDGDLNVMNTVEGELDCSAEELMEDTGKATVTIGYDNWLVDWMTHQTMPIADLNLIIDFDPLHPNWRRRWGGKITELHVQKDDQGIHKITITALHFREHAKRLLIAANPIFPPEVQLPKMWVLPGPVRTICALSAFINLGRLFMPIWSTITNVFNPAGWISPLSPDAVLDFLPTNWPIQVAFVDPVFDQSRWSTIGAHWTDWHATFKDILSDAGVMMRCYTYLTTDEDSPNTELAKLLTLAPDLLSLLTGIDASSLDQGLDKLVAPLRNCAVFSFEQIDGVTGPTGTAADGLLSTVAVTLDDLITPVVVDPTTGNAWDAGQVLNGEPVYDAAGVGETYLLQQLLDVAPAPPKVIWWDGNWTGMINTDLTWHKGAVKTIMTGSKSPVIVNESISFAIRYSLAELSLVLNNWVAGVSGQTQVPGTPGLDNLYMGQLSDVFLAWERYTDPIRALNTGSLAWQEHFEKGGSGTAYTLASILTLRDGDWKTRAFAAFKAETLNGWPWIAGTDFTLGDRVGFEQDGIIYVDNVYALKWEYSWQQPLRVHVKIGEDRNRGDPFNAAFKTIGNVYSFASQLAGEGTIFSGG